MGKERRKSKSEEKTADIEIKTEKTELSYEEQLPRLSPIANPLASRKLTKRLYRVIKKAQSVKSLRKGVKEVQKSLRRNEKGFLVLAGDVYPIDMIAHFPVLCEDRRIPYCYIPSREMLGDACRARVYGVVVLVMEHADYKDLYDQCFEEIASLPLPIT